MQGKKKEKKATQYVENAKNYTHEKMLLPIRFKHWNKRYITI